VRHKAGLGSKCRCQYTVNFFSNPSFRYASLSCVNALALPAHGSFRGSGVIFKHISDHKCLKSNISATTSLRGLARLTVVVKYFGLVISQLQSKIRSHDILMERNCLPPSRQYEVG
jgi:hypothetical protein